MSDPFQIDGPAVISFSGGRTSGYMLWLILNACDGLPDNVVVLFADTGKERAETYDFVRACETQWRVPIHWVERPGQFAQLITDRRGLPNPLMRFCSQELKVRPIRDWCLAHGWEHWTSVVGIRADEPRRIAKMRLANETRSERWDLALPLADAGITEADVMTFWASQNFDLQLRSAEGNCDMCFLKGFDKLKNLVRERPDLAEWWAQQEERTGSTFRRDRPSYRSMLAQGDLFLGLDDENIECFCHD